MEGEDNVRTVDCLRGRLLAERSASRNAKEEAQQLENKLMELENLLKQEAKSRSRAEKKLKLLMKKLESMNILHISDESEYSGFVDKTDISSISSTASSIIKQQTKLSEVFETRESKGKAMFQKDLGNLEQIDSQLSLSDDSSTPEGTSISSAFECQMRRVVQNEDSLSSASDQHYENSSSKIDRQSDHSISSCGDDSESQVDDSMALVVVDTPQTSHEALDATVRDVLNTLRNAKEQLQSSMERRRMNVIKTSAIFI